MGAVLIRYFHPEFLGCFEGHAFFIMKIHSQQSGFYESGIFWDFRLFRGTCIFLLWRSIPNNLAFMKVESSEFLGCFEGHAFFIMKIHSQQSGFYESGIFWDFRLFRWTCIFLLWRSIPNNLAFMKVESSEFLGCFDGHAFFYYEDPFPTIRLLRKWNLLRF